MISYNDRAGPVDFLQRVFESVYNISKLPLFIETNHIKNPGDISYYSLTLPVLTNFSHKSRKCSIMSEITELYDVLQVILSRIKKEDMNHSLYYQIKSWSEKFEYSFFHVNKSSDSNFLLHSSELSIIDSKISGCLEKFPKLDFSYSDTFFRGCVRIIAK